MAKNQDKNVLRFLRIIFSVNGVPRKDALAPNTAADDENNDINSENPHQFIVTSNTPISKEGIEVLSGLSLRQFSCTMVDHTNMDFREKMLAGKLKYSFYTTEGVKPLPLSIDSIALTDDGLIANVSNKQTKAYISYNQIPSYKNALDTIQEQYPTLNLEKNFETLELVEQALHIFESSRRSLNGAIESLTGFLERRGIQFYDQREKALNVTNTAPCDEASDPPEHTPP